MTVELTHDATPLGFDSSRLDEFLRSKIVGLEGNATVQPIAGGQSNPTFFVSYANRRLVLRKQPRGALLPSAHAVDREYRIMTALAHTDVPVPRTILFHAGRALLGTPFYVMERVEGRVFSDPSLGEVASPAERRAMYLAMGETLARLHGVDWNSLGLRDFGKSGNYYTRQINRWSQQWNLSKTRQIPEVDTLSAWLSSHIPADDTTAISHGDFRMGNLMFHPREPRVVAVLDWELSTLGHPLADVAYSALAWRLLPSEYMGMRGCDLQLAGIPSEREYLEHYIRWAPASGPLEPFHFAFALFRLAIIFEGIAARARDGHAAAADAAEVGTLSIAFARRGLEAAST